MHPALPARARRRGPRLLADAEINSRRADPPPLRNGCHRATGAERSAITAAFSANVNRRRTNSPLLPSAMANLPPAHTSARSTAAQARAIPNSRSRGRTLTNRPIRMTNAAKAVVWDAFWQLPSAEADTTSMRGIHLITGTATLTARWHFGCPPSGGRRNARHSQQAPTGKPQQNSATPNYPVISSRRQFTKLKKLL